MAGTAEDNVVIRNVYHMMAYAFKALSLQEYAELTKEDFGRFEDLLAAILALGIGVQRKRGSNAAISKSRKTCLVFAGISIFRELPRTGLRSIAKSSACTTSIPKALT